MNIIFVQTCLFLKKEFISFNKLYIRKLLSSELYARIIRMRMI